MEEIISDMFDMQGAILLLLAAGYFFGRQEILSRKTCADLTQLMLKLILPCNIFLSFLSNTGRSALLQYAEILFAAAVLQIILSVASRFAFQRAEQAKKACLQYGLLCSNATFIGLPIIEAVYGSAGVACASIAVLPMRIVMWTDGYFLFHKRTKSPDEKNEIWKKALLNPCMAAVAAGLLAMAANAALPGFLYSGLSYVSRCTSGMAMLIIGGILSRIDLKSVLDRELFFYCFGRLILIPAAVLALGRLCRLPSDELGILVLMQAMPMATTGVMLAQQCGANSEYAGGMMCLSTICSAITIPAILTLLI